MNQAREITELKSQVMQLSRELSRLPVRQGATLGGGGGATPYLITERLSGGASIAVYRFGASVVSGKRATGSGPFSPTGDEVDLLVSLMHGVSFTDQVVLVESVNGVLRITGGWVNTFFRAIAVDNILAADSGQVALRYADYLGLPQSANVSAVNTIGRMVSTGQSLLVNYGTTLLGEGFYIVDAECPT